MPCVRTDTGEVVPGAFGSCPIGSTWQDNAVPQISMADAPKDDLPLQRVSIEPVSRGAQTLALGTAVAAPFLRGGFNYAKKKIKDPKNIDRLVNLRNRLFKRFDKPERPKYPIMNQAQQAAWRQRNPGTWRYDPIKLTSAAGVGGFALTQLIDALRGKEDTTEKKKTAPAFMTDAQRREQLDSSPKELSKWEQLSADFKDPDWWMKSMSGLPHDTRLHRLGMLMDYYGRTPKGRAAVDMPAEVWARNEQEALAARAAALKGKTGDEVYGKKSLDDLAADLLPDVKEMFGDTLFRMSSNPDASDEEAMRSLAEQVATNIKAISNAYPNLTPGEVRKLALEQLMKDRPDLERLN